MTKFPRAKAGLAGEKVPAAVAVAWPEKAVLVVLQAPVEWQALRVLVAWRVLAAKVALAALLVPVEPEVLLAPLEWAELLVRAVEEWADQAAECPARRPLIVLSLQHA